MKALARSFVLVVVSAPTFAQSLVNGGFETGVPICNLPTGPGFWAGDEVQYLSSSQGITPIEGTRMARFLTACNGCVACCGGGACELWQIVDLTPIATQVATGQVVAEASAKCNRIAGTPQTDTQFGLGLSAYAGSPSTFPSQWNTSELAITTNYILTDSLPGTWEDISVSLCVPPTTGFLVVRFFPVENVQNNCSGLEFDGHYGDDVTFSVTSSIGTAYCSPAIPNSTGLPGTITAMGSSVVIDNDVTLTAAQLPVDFGYFLTGQTQGLFNPPGSSGFICLSGAIGRYNQPQNIIVGPTGSIQIDLTAVPQPAGLVAVVPGDTWNFQCWYRDVGNTNNFTDAISVTFR